MNIPENLQEQITKVVQGLFDTSLQAQIEIPNNPEHGDFSTNVAMVLSKELKRNPLEIAEEIKEALSNTVKAEGSKLEALSSIEVVKPGFVNFRLDSNIYKSIVETITNQKENFGKSETHKSERIMLEYAHPNPFKSFHIGHLRNIILGVSLIQLIENQSAEIIPVNYQGDVGMHIAKCLWSFRNIKEIEYPDTGDAKVALLGKCYAEGATAFEDNAEAKEEIKAINKKIYTREDSEITKLWELGKGWSLEKNHEIYERVGAKFVREYMESEVMDLGVQKVQEALEKGILEKSEGAVVFNGQRHGLDTRVFLNSEGLPTYEGKELGLAYYEFSDFGKIDLCIHNVAVEQISFFKVTFKVEELLDPELFQGKQYHNVYEFVGLKKGKMSSRKGNVILGNDILNEARERIKEYLKDKSDNELAEKLAVAAVKYSFLKVSPKTYLAFDMDESISLEGDSGPYIMYSYARAKSVLRQQENIKHQITNIKEVLNSDEELEILKHLNQFPEIVENAAKEYAPNTICTYVYELAQAFNKFYNTHKVLKAENQDLINSRIHLVAATAQVIKNSLTLLGIETVEKM